MQKSDALEMVRGADGVWEHQQPKQKPASIQFRLTPTQYGVKHREDVATFNGTLIRVSVDAITKKLTLDVDGFYEQTIPQERRNVRITVPAHGYNMTTAGAITISGPISIEGRA